MNIHLPPLTYRPIRVAVDGLAPGCAGETHAYLAPTREEPTVLRCYCGAHTIAAKPSGDGAWDVTETR